MNSCIKYGLKSWQRPRNIGTLLRSDQNGNTADNFSYAYSGNKLSSINGGTSYTYDLNGNTQTDGLRAMTIGYNVLNLPNTISKSSESISYIYSASGEKLAKRMKDNSYLYYGGNMVYNNDKSLKYILFEEGMVNKSSGAYTYEYHLKDHLGNTRVAFQPNGGGTTTTQVAEYYPFGSSYLPLNPAGTNKYLYNGKEKQDDVLSNTALDEYDYGARFYDAKIGRWHAQYPYAEAFFDITSYAYVKNNPILRLDPNGLWDVEVHAYKNRGEYGNAVLIMRDYYGSEVFRTTVRVQGTATKENNYNPRDRQAKNGMGDTPTGTYKILGWSDRLSNIDREKYGPNDALELDYVSGEAAGKRNRMHLHGGRQEEKKNGQWVKNKNANLWNTGGCIRSWDDDLQNMKELSQFLEIEDPVEGPDELKLFDDLVKKKNKKKESYEYEEKKETWSEVSSIIQKWLLSDPSLRVNYK